MDLTFRQANVTDLEEIQELFVETIKNTCKNDYTMEQIDVWISSIENKERWMSFLIEQYFIIAENENKIVGFSSLEKGNHVDFMYVHKDFLRKGVANMLFKKLKDKSIKLGFDKLTADVSKTARPFFENKGFKVVRENKNMIKAVEIINFHMRQ
ncbi:MAG: GNAT family N-acetyltransferase [Crocinitomicaceae bacterium]